MTVTKKEMLVALASKTNMTQAEVDRFLEVLATFITNESKKGNKVMLPGVGTFSKKHRPSRIVRNPRTGAKMKSAEKHVPAFKATSSFVEHVK